MSDFKYLFSPYRIGKVEIKNRMVFQPHVPYYATLDGYPSETTKRYYLERAKGGTGLIVIESLMVHPGVVYAPGCICMWKDGIVEAFRDLPERVHKYGAKIFGQLSHPGSNVLTKPHQFASGPSQTCDIGHRIVPKELDRDEIKEIVVGFGLSAQRLQEAGFDGVELKFAHDGLLRAFCLPEQNKRTDEYGGSYENRCRFFAEIMEEIRKRVGSDFPVGVRLCLDQYVEGGITQDYGIQLAKTCEELGVDYINGDSGSCADGSMQIFPMGMPLGAGVYLASAVKKAVNIPVVAFGRLNDPVMMEAVLEEGHADFVGSARQFICDPETANKAMEGRLDDIRHCIACNDGCIFQCIQTKPIHCIQYPATGREEKLGIGTLQKTTSPKKIMVIGGGVAGMKFAEIAAKRGHQVTLYEKSNRLGGQINLAERLPYRDEIGEVTRYLKIQLQKLNVVCKLGVEVDCDFVINQNPDVVVVATGSKAYVPPIKGIETAALDVLNARQVVEHPENIGSRVVVLDRNGHIKATGVCELALAINAKVDYFTPYEKMGVDIDAITIQMVNRRLFDYENFSYHTYYDIAEINGRSVTMKHIYSDCLLTLEDVDTLIVVNHPLSDRSLYKELKECRNEVYAIGDCNAPRLIEQAIYESEMLARTV